MTILVESGQVIRGDRETIENLTTCFKFFHNVYFVAHPSTIPVTDLLITLHTIQLFLFTISMPYYLSHIITH